MEQHDQPDNSDLFERYRDAIGYGKSRIWDDEIVFNGSEINFPQTKAGKMPKNMRVKGCWCWDSWHSRLDVSHQWESYHLSAKYRVNHDVLRTIRILPYALGGMRSWNRELTPEQWKRAIPGGKPTLDFLVNYAVSVHMAFQLGMIKDDWQYTTRVKMYKDMVGKAEHYDVPKPEVEEFRGQSIRIRGEEAPAIHGLEVVYSGGTNENL